MDRVVSLRPHGALRAVLPLVAVFASFLAGPRPAAAALTFARPGFSADVVASGLPFATSVAFRDDGRLFIALKSGVVRVWRNGELLPRPFIDLSAQVNDTFDRGLLDIALHPDFPEQPYVYLLFTRDPPGVVADGVGARVARLVRVEADPAADYDVALPGMQNPQPAGCDAEAPPVSCPGHVILLGRASLRPYIGDEFNGRNLAEASCMVNTTMGEGPLRLPPQEANVSYPPGTSPPIEDCLPADASTHTIGSLAFAPDGALFVSSGDGAGFNVVDPRALRSLYLESLAGKILRIDPRTGDGWPDNPFFDPNCPDCNRSKVWSLGLRNPFRFALDPASGEPVVGDVGWNTWEEFNRGRGANFGWPCYEGGAVDANEGGVTASLVQSAYAANTETAAACADLYARGVDFVQAPVFAYDHVEDGYGGTNGASANAGAFYVGSSYPEDLHGALFILDYNRRWIRTLTFDEQGRASVGNFAREDAAGMVKIIAGPDTNLYVIVYAGQQSELRRIRYTAGGNTPPAAIASAAPTVGVAPLRVQFDAAASFDTDAQPLLYAWDFGDGNVSYAVAPVHVFTQPGTYRVTLQVSEATAPFATDETTLEIRAGLEPPVASILSPADGSRFRVGDRISYIGSGRSGATALPATDLSWELRLHHNEHVHFSPLGSGNFGEVEAEEHGADSYFELCLTAQLLPEVTDTDCVSLLPETATLSVFSEPPGMTVVYEDEGGDRITPFVAEPVVGSLEMLTVPVEQQGRTFLRWSDGDTSPSRQVAIGDEPISLTAVFSEPAAACGDTPQLHDVRLHLRGGRVDGRTTGGSLHARVVGDLPDPSVRGLRLELRPGATAPEAWIEAPAGAAWQARDGGWSWRGTTAREESVRLRLKPTDVPREWQLRVVSRRVSLPLVEAASIDALRLTFPSVTDAAAICAEVSFTRPPPEPSCRTTGSGRAVVCY